MEPFDLVQQGAMVDFVDLMQRANNTNVQNAQIFQSNIVDPSSVTPSTQFALDQFVASPSPLPSEQPVASGNEFSDPDPFVAQAQMVPDGFGGLLLQPGPRPDNIDLDLLSSLNPSSVQALSGQTAEDVTSLGLQTDDPFGTPNPDRTRQLLRRLFDQV